MYQAVLALLLQIAFVAAAPVHATKDDMLGYHVGGGVVGFIVLVLDIIVWCKSSSSLSAPPLLPQIQGKKEDYDLRFTLTEC